jgi:hypothetical protein
MSDDLVGYLLGAIDQDAAERVERELTKNPRQRLELDRIALAMRPLAADADDEDPPAGLAERTARRVLEHARPEPWGAAPTASWRLTDVAVAASILLVVSLVILPALQQSRDRKLVVECSNHLRQIAVALDSYAEDHGQYFPISSGAGPLGVAGVYAPILLECGLVSDASVFVCPAAGDDARSIPRLNEIRAALDDIDRLDGLLRSMGGSYGYQLGIKRAERYYPPRRDRFAGRVVLSDRPVRSGEGTVGQSNSPNHRGRGQNLLYRDGHVGFLESPCEGPYGDNIFQNLIHRVAPGLDWYDSVIGPSEARLGKF